MREVITLLTGAGLGASMMYFFDPQSGRRRRALMRDQCVHACNKSAKAADVVRRDVGNRLFGAYSEVRSSLRNEATPDEVLVDRVRSKLGRYASHPSSIKVTAEDGRVSLRGLVLAEEAQRLIPAVRRIRGVADVNNELSVQDEPGQAAGLEGGLRRAGEPIDLLQEHWTPATRFALGAAGVGLAALCIGRRSSGA